MTNRLFAGLLGLILLMQGWILYRQYQVPSLQRPTAERVKILDEPVELELGAFPLMGSRSAKVAMIEFSDFECPFCERHARDVGQKLKAEFVTNGRVMLAFAHNPLPIHKNARLLAKSAICSGNEHFWEMHDRIFGKKLRDLELLLPEAKQIGLDEIAFKKCIESGSTAEERIALDMQAAQRLHITGTPAFAIGRTNVMGRVSIDRIIVGAQPFEVFQTTLDGSLLSAANSVNSEQ